jgi:hypothetical protein
MSTLLVATAIENTYPPGVVHQATDWEIATDTSFSNIIHASYNNTQQLTTYSVILSQSGPFYVRSRFRFNVGISQWSNAVSCSV